MSNIEKPFAYAPVVYCLPWDEQSNDADKNSPTLNVYGVSVDDEAVTYTVLSKIDRSKLSEEPVLGGASDALEPEPYDNIRPSIESVRTSLANPLTRHIQVVLVSDNERHLALPLPETFNEFRKEHLCKGLGRHSLPIVFDNATKFTTATFASALIGEGGTDPCILTSPNPLMYANEVVDHWLGLSSLTEQDIEVLQTILRDRPLIADGEIKDLVGSIVLGAYDDATTPSYKGLCGCAPYLYNNLIGLPGRHTYARTDAAEHIMTTLMRLGINIATVYDPEKIRSTYDVVDQKLRQLYKDGVVLLS